MKKLKSATKRQSDAHTQEIKRYIDMFTKDCMRQLSDLEHFMKNSMNKKQLVHK